MKRSLQGSPASIPNNLPAFRGKKLAAPDKNVKVPKLTQGNRPNEGSNIAIPYNRICPLEFLSGWSGRLSPGDVAFVSKYPPGFLSANSGGTNGTATMARVIGVDGVNRLLHGEGNPDGWVLGDNVLGVPAGTSPMAILDPEQLGGFKGLSTLNGIRLDGIIKSNDEPYAFTSSGSRDAVVFNTIIQGPTLCNNGFLMYDPRGNPGYRMMADPKDGDVDAMGGVLENGPTGGGTPLRTVESHPRGSVEGGYHLGSAGGAGQTGRVGSQWLNGTGQYDYVASFTGTFSTYPTQMFDRSVEPMNTLYLGLRAWKMSDRVKGKVRESADLAPGSAVLTGMDCYFFQVVPFASRKAYLCQKVEDDHVKEIAEKEAATGTPLSEAEKTAIRTAVRGRMSARTPSHKRGEKKSRFDDDLFDAVRTVDLKNMVGAWTVGRVLDVKAMRNTSYEGGPADSSFALTVDVQTCWRNALPKPTGTGQEVKDGHQYVDYGTNTVNREGKVVKENINNAQKDRLAIDIFNAQFPSMAQSVGDLFGVELGAMPIDAAAAAAATAAADAAAAAEAEKNKTVAQQIMDGLKAAGQVVKDLPGDLAKAVEDAKKQPVFPEPGNASKDVPGIDRPDNTFQAPAGGQSTVSHVPVPGAAAASSSVGMTSTAAAAAPVVAAAMAAAKASKPGGVTRTRAKSPARTGARPAATTTAAAATTAAATTAAADAPIGGADLSSASAAPLRRDRGAAQPSTVSAVFDSIFGDTSEPTAAPASPTPSSGSDTSGLPKTFRRPR